jgi:alkylation response protein AidB-like acyl-CoA dehydrogenase
VQRFSEFCKGGNALIRPQVGQNMDFQFTKEQRDIRTAARDFAEKQFPEIAAKIDEKEEFPFELWKKACELGLIGCFIPEEYGGAGYGVTEQCCIAEEFFRVDPGCGQCMNSVAVGSEVILMFGNEKQKKTFLSPLARGETIMGIAITEPDAGSDVLSVATTAERIGNDFIITGSKMFITNGSIANYLVVFCMTSPGKNRASERFSMIIVETDRPGYESNKLRGKLGIRASDTAEVRLTDVKVPIHNLVGEEGKGFPYLMRFFGRTRVMVAATGVGLAQGALERAVGHIKRRRQFGKPLSDFQGNRFKLAEMATLVEAARNLTYKAAADVDRGILDSAVIAMAKWYSAWVAVHVADESLQMHGGYGYMAEYDISRFYRDAKILEIYEGTKEIEKEIIARSFLRKQFT